MQIIWAQRAVKGLQKIYEHIAEDSPFAAEKIVEQIVDKVTELKDNPERYAVDKYKKDNAGNYRSFEYKRVRISYKIYPQSIEIVRVRHTKQKQMSY